MKKEKLDSHASSFLQQLFCPHLRLVDVDSVSVVAEAAVERPVVVQETLKLQRHFFPFSRSFLTTTQNLDVIPAVHPNIQIQFLQTSVAAEHFSGHFSIIF